MKRFITLNKLVENEHVAIISPSSGIAGLFPWVQDLGLKRIRNVFHLKPVEYTTTRTINASLENRAKDIIRAFGDEENKAVIASIGGTDQIRLIKYLNPDIFIKNPKPFFGYSDNTHMHIFLWNLGIPSYYGGSVMTQFAMQNKMDAMTAASIKTALFESKTVQLAPSEEFNDIELEWADKNNLDIQRKYERNDGWHWATEDGREIKGILWGGCVESLVLQFSVGKYLPNKKDLEGIVLFIETAEYTTEHWVVEYLLTDMGERGWIDNFQAILVGRPKAWDRTKQDSSIKKEEYKSNQRSTIINVVRKYNADIPIIQNMDFGHTDPQIIVPMGKNATIDTKNRQIFFEY